jgi:hypothetical protein
MLVAVLTAMICRAQNTMPVAGPWYQADFLGMEETAHPTPGLACTRAWMKQRNLSITPMRGTDVVGSYGEWTRTRLLGMQSFDKKCTFPSSPDVFTPEIWNLIGAAESGAAGRWLLLAGPTTGSAARQQFRVASDRTSLSLWKGAPSAPPITLTRVVPATSRELAAVIQTTAQRIMGDDCIGASQEMFGPGIDPARTRDGCELQQRLSVVAGGLAAVEVVSIELFSRMPAKFPAPGLGGDLVPAEGALVSFVMKFSNNQETSGDAVITRRGTRWHFDALWL